MGKDILLEVFIFPYFVTERLYRSSGVVDIKSMFKGINYYEFKVITLTPTTRFHLPNHSLMFPPFRKISHKYFKSFSGSQLNFSAVIP